ncbi:putative NRPS-like enzyme [Phyllosticta citribraziliensis]|uniref:NRPS-like enzyme n=1 Tax=Phyllosticta citribraziliensis TaxID=989973 RepID=A0ABR1M134_9PEZI
MLSTITPSIPAKPTLTASAAEIVPKGQQQSQFGSSFGKILLSEDSPRTVDELIRARAKSDPDFSVFAYPWTGTTYTHYTFRQLDVYAYRIAKKFAEVLPPRRSASEEPTVVGMLGVSTFDYFVTMLALTKLGHTCLLMSTRIVQEAHSSLIKNTGAQHMVVDANFGDMASALSKEWPGLQVLPMATRADYEKPISEAEAAIDTNLTPHLDPETLRNQAVWIIHSSGSTSLPKAVPLTHTACMHHYAIGLSVTALILGPLFHVHGKSCTFRGIFNKCKVYQYNAELPITRQGLIDIIKNNDLRILFGVPYALNLLAETEEGIQCLKKFSMVTFGGSPCPDALGDRLVAEDVNLMAYYGATETGMIMSSQRPPEDKVWNYLRPAVDAVPYLRFEAREEGLYELVVLDGWKSKMLTNRPDGHYNTKDCFVPHPSIPNAWKYYCRIDDTLTLVNSEKANPLQVEGHARQSRFVEHALMFGAGRDRLGLAVVLTKAADNKSRDEILDDVFKVIKPAHDALPAYAKIDRDMVLILPAETQCRCTDKGTVIRQPFYRQFAAEIDAMYDEAATGTLALSEPELRDFVRKQVAALTDKNELSDDADFFALGMDSLQTARLRTALTKNLDIGGQQLGLNVVFDYPSIAALAQHLFSLRTAASSTTEIVAGIPAEKIAEMEAMIERYSTPLPPPSQTNTSEKGHVVLLTGATGSLGAHIAAQLAALPSVTRVYCLVRAHDAEHASKRLDESFQTRHLKLSDASRAKLAPLSSDLSRDDLGLDADTREQIEQHVSHVLAVGWAVNFTVALRSFEAENVAGVRRLLEIASRSARAARFTFASSVSVVGNLAAMQQQATGPLRVDEALPPSTAAALNMGYGQSKLVTEHVCMRAAAQVSSLRSRVLRVGQIVGDMQEGVWNTSEAVPLMLRTAMTLGALPALDDAVRWLPVDDVARAFVEVGVLEEEAPAAVYNVNNPHKIHWTRDLLPMLRECGLKFETVSMVEWLERLRQSEKDPAKNPSIKLLAFWEQQMNGEKKELEVEWATERVREWSPTMAKLQATDKGLVQKMIEYFVQEGWK